MTATEPRRVLLIEDNPLDSRTIASLLRGEDGFAVESTETLAQGLAALERDRFTCVLLDLTLPDSDGLVSVDTVVARSPHCPVVVLTGLDDPAVAVEAVERGAQDYLFKSTMTGELIARAIRYAVARQWAETELIDAKQRLHSLHARQQIARDLHDTVIQRLFAAGLSLQTATKLDSRVEMAERADLVVDEIDAAIGELRSAVTGLNRLEDEESFVEELSAIADSYRHGLEFEPVVRVGDLPPLPERMRIDALAVVREAFSNIARHANATTATLTVATHDGELLVRVTDNGDGADTIGTSHSVEPGFGNGLANMRARARAHGGELQLSAKASGGVEVRWQVPLPVRVTPEDRRV